MFASITDAVEAQKVPQLAELLTGVAEKVTVDKIAEVIAESITSGNDASRRKFALEYAGLLKQYQQMTGEITRDEVSRMADDQIEAILRDEYGFGRQEVPPVTVTDDNEPREQGQPEAAVAAEVRD